MKYPRIILAATASGSGKTTITCGILGALLNKGIKPCSFKCGPDYIDPMFHRNVLGISSGNLDTFFTDKSVTRQLFEREFSGDIAVIEGVMGLYDGIGGVGLTGSTYDLAKALEAPIILVINARGMGRSILAQIKGFLDYDTDHLIKGVILNKISKSFGATLKELIETELNIKVIGTVENNKDIVLDSRHLGLVMPNELDNITETLETLEEMVVKGIDLQEFVNIANRARGMDFNDIEDIVNTNSIRLAVARDDAFCFYYRENLTMLKAAGVEIVEFSPLRDKKLPDNIAGLLLGGGYPENYLKELAANKAIKDDIKAKVLEGMPVLAECGGFMYLMDKIYDKNGDEFSMVQAIDGEAFFTGKLVRFGYINLQDDTGLNIKGHEFHYYDTNNNGDDLLAKKPVGDVSYSCIHKMGNSYVGFPHLYYPSSPEFVNNFVEAMKNYGEH